MVQVDVFTYHGRWFENEGHNRKQSYDWAGPISQVIALGTGSDPNPFPFSQTLLPG